MDVKYKNIPQTFIENMDMVNSATKFMNYKNNDDLLNLKIKQKKYNKYNNNQNALYNSNSLNKTQNENSTNIQTKNQKESFQKIRNLKYNYATDTLNTSNNTKKFAWSEIMNNNKNIENENNLDNPLINNILNSEINEKDIQNIPENYLINLIQTLQCVASKAIQNKNNLISENNKLNNDLSQITLNYNNVIQNNNKMNQAILNLNKQNNEQKKIIKNYENNNKEEFDDIEVNKIINKEGYKQKYYCPFCSNKKFKNQQYLEEHINRRHANYYQRLLKNEKKQQKINAKIYENKLNEFKKFFELLISQSIKKSRYIRLNEKLIGIQNLMLISDYNHNNYYNNENNNNNTYYSEMNIDGIIQDKNKYLHESFNEKLNKHNNNININKMEINEEENIDFNNFEKVVKKLKNEMKQYFEKNIKEIVELNNEKKFQAIKKYFENTSEENQSDIFTQLHSRRDNKNRTTKIKKINLFNSHFDLNQSRNERTDNENINEEEDNIYENNYYNNEKIDIKGKNKNEPNKINSEKKISNNKELNNSEKSSGEKENSKRDKKISFSETESQLTERNIFLEKFYLNFRNRDACFSKAKDKYYLKKIIPDDFSINQKTINSLIEEKINKKLSDLKKTTNEDWISDIIKLYFQILDKNSIYGNVHLFYSRNMNNYLNIKKLVDDANNYYYQGRGIEGIKNYSDISKVVNERSTNVFEYIDYQIQNNEEVEKNDFSFRI